MSLLGIVWVSDSNKTVLYGLLSGVVADELVELSKCFVVGDFGLNFFFCLGFFFSSFFFYFFLNKKH